MRVVEQEMGARAAAAPIVEAMFNLWMSRTLWAAARLRIADAIGDGAKSVEEIAAEVGAHSGALKRLLNALTGHGIFAQSADGRYTLTPTSQLLRSDHPMSMRASVDAITGHEHFAAWGGLEDALRSGEPSFDRIYGMNWVEFYARNPEQGRLFGEAMSGTTRMFDGVILQAHRFEPFHLAVDVGGSHGSLVRALLQREQQARGIVFDLPDTVAAGPALWAGSPEADRLQAVGGNFFESVPEGGDLYLLKFILHDWDDERAAAILMNVRRAILPEGRLAIMETVLPDEPGAPHPGWLMDLNMLVMTGGRERSAKDYQALLEAAGFRMTRVTPTESPMSVIEAVPA